MKTIKIATSYLLLGAVPLAFTTALVFFCKEMHVPSILIDSLLVLNFFAYVAAATVTAIKGIRSVLSTGLQAGIVRIAWFLFGVVIVLWAGRDVSQTRLLGPRTSFASPQASQEKYCQ